MRYPYGFNLVLYYDIYFLDLQVERAKSPTNHIKGPPVKILVKLPAHTYIHIQYTIPNYSAATKKESPPSRFPETVICIGGEDKLIRSEEEAAPRRKLNIFRR
jgi:hypothetical protein